MAADLEQTQAIFFDEFDDETDDEDTTSKGPVSHLKVFSTADFQEKIFPLHEGNNVIGRQEGVCDICIPLKALSREHACIEIQGDSHLIYDKGSRNKTRRGKLFLSPDVRYELKHNDQLKFGDVSCVYLIENQKGESGSETGSESIFQTASTDTLGTDLKQGALEGTMVVEEDGYESDESVDLLQPTQAYVGNSTSTLKIAPDSDEEEQVKKIHNITVKDTPAQPRLKGTSTLVLPESDSETDDEEQKKLKSNVIQTLYIEETQKDDSAEGDILYAPTQACHVTESDDETTDDEECNDLQKNIFTAATQAFTDIGTKKDETDNSHMPTQSFVAESDEEKQEESKTNPVVKEIEITDDESTDDEDGVRPDVSHLFANPTLACDLEDYNDQDDQNKPCVIDKPTQEFSGENDPTQTFENVSQLGHQNKKDETLVIHEGATLAVEDVTMLDKNKPSDEIVKGDIPAEVFGGDETLAINESPVSKKALSPSTKSKDDDSTQVFSADEDQTVAVSRSPVSKTALSPSTKSKDDDSTQVFSGDEDQTVSVSKSPVSKKALSPSMKSKDDGSTQVFSGDEDQTVTVSKSLALSPNLKSRNEDPTQVFCDNEDQTLAINESPISKKQSVMPDKKSEVENATLELGDPSLDATVTVSDEILPSTKRNKRGRRNAKQTATEPVGNADATVAVNDIADYASVSDIKSVECNTRSKQMSKGKRSVKNVKSADADNIIKEAATVAVSDETQADNTTETKQRKPSRRGKKKSPFSNDTVDATVAVANDTLPGNEIDLGEDKKNKIVSSDEAGMSYNDATQVFEEPSISPVKDDKHAAASSKNQLMDVSNDNTQTLTSNATLLISESDEPKRRGRACKNKSKEDNKSTETAVGKKKQRKCQDKNTSHDATRAIADDVATQVFDNMREDDAVDNFESKKGDKSKQSDRNSAARRKDDKKTIKHISETKISEETADDTPSSSTKSLQAMEGEDDDATPVIDPTQPYCIENDETTVSLNIEPTQPYCMEDDETTGHMNTEPTQPYCLEEEMSPSQDKESTEDIEERNDGLKCPVVPLPPTSPHKSVLASPNKHRQKSPSPKRVKFNVKKDMSEHSLEIGNEPSTSNVLTREKIDVLEENASKSTKKGKKKEAANLAVPKSTRGRRSAQVETIKDEEEKTNKKGRKSLPVETQETEQKKTTRTSIRRSVPAAMETYTEEIRVGSSGVKLRGKGGKTKVLEDIGEKSGDTVIAKDDIENPCKTEKSETKPAKKARGKRSIQTVTQNEKIQVEHVDVEDTSSKTLANKKSKNKSKEHPNDIENPSEEKPISKKTKEKSSKHKNVSEEINKADDTQVELGRLRHGRNSDVHDGDVNISNEDKPSTSTSEDVQVSSGRRKRGHTSTINPADNNSGEIKPGSSDNAIEDDKTQTEGKSRTRKGRNSAIKKDETKNTQCKDEKEVSNSSSRSKRKRGRENESVEVDVDISVDQSMMNKSGKLGKGSENVEAGSSKNDVPLDTLVKLKKTGTNRKSDINDEMINDQSKNESVSNAGKKRKAEKDDKMDSQDGEAKGRRSKRRKVAENSDDSQGVEAGEKRLNIDHGEESESDQDKQLETTSRKKPRKSNQNVTVVKESNSKNNSKRGKQIENDVAQSLSTRKQVNTLTVSSPSLRRKSTEPKPKVLFTGLVDEQGQRIVKDLGGELVSSVYDCTHLVTDKVRRTLKFLCCLSRGIPIVKTTWLENCNQSKKFIDYTEYLVHDTSSEKQYNFSLRKSIEKAGEASLLDGYKIHATKSVKPDPSQIEDIIKCSGGEYLKTLPKKNSDNTIVISCPDDKHLCEAALKADIPVVNAEFILTGILRQEVDVNTYRIFTEGNSRKRGPADSDAGVPSKRRR